MCFILKFTSHRSHTFTFTHAKKSVLSEAKKTQQLYEKLIHHMRKCIYVEVNIHIEAYVCMLQSGRKVARERERVGKKVRESVHAVAVECEVKPVTYVNVEMKCEET